MSLFFMIFTYYNVLICSEFQYYIIIVSNATIIYVVDNVLMYNILRTITIMLIGMS